MLLQAVLRAICEDVQAVSSDRTASSSMQSFYAVLLCELLLTTQPVSPAAAVMQYKLAWEACDIIHSE